MKKIETNIMRTCDGCGRVEDLNAAAWHNWIEVNNFDICYKCQDTIKNNLLYSLSKDELRTNLDEMDKYCPVADIILDKNSPI